MTSLIDVAVWLPLSLGVAIVLGRIIRERDRHH